MWIFLCKTTMTEIKAVMWQSGQIGQLEDPTHILLLVASVDLLCLMWLCRVGSLVRYVIAAAHNNWLRTFYLSVVEGLHPLTVHCKDSLKRKVNDKGQSQISQSYHTLLYTYWHLRLHSACIANAYAHEDAEPQQTNGGFVVLNNLSFFNRIILFHLINQLSNYIPEVPLQFTIHFIFPKY